MTFSCHAYETCLLSGASQRDEPQVLHKHTSVMVFFAPPVFVLCAMWRTAEFKVFHFSLTVFFLNTDTTPGDTFLCVLGEGKVQHCWKYFNIYKAHSSLFCLLIAKI